MRPDQHPYFCAQAVLTNSLKEQNPDTNMLCTQPFIDWENSTHYIDNNICEWREK